MKEQLESWILEEKLSYIEIGKRLGLSPNGVKKKAKSLGINLPKRINYNGHNEQFIKDKHCINCGKKVNKVNQYKKKYCSTKCQNEYQYKQYIQKWKNGEVEGMKGAVGISACIRKYLFEKYDNKCCKCGWSEVNEYTGKIPLQVNHMDGNCLNNEESNLELICPNCHALTETWGRANKSKGRRKIIEENKINKTMGTE